jgi:hypothetical protein
VLPPTTASERPGNAEREKPSGHIKLLVWAIDARNIYALVKRSQFVPFAVKRFRALTNLVNRIKYK